MTSHLLLTAANGREEAEARVARFFGKNFLVRYDRVVVLPERTVHAGEAAFDARLAAGIAANRRLVAELLAELEAAGIGRLAELATLPQGYETKVLHTIVHLLDGFFGVDTFFYNLEEDAHGVSPRLAAAIAANPAGFWLVEVACGSEPGHDADRLALIRKFATEPPG